MTAETATQAGTDAETTAGPQTEDQADTSSSAVGDDGAVAENAVTEAVDSDADEDEADATDVDDETDDDDSDEDEDDEDRLVEEGEIAGDYLEQLLDVLDFDGDIDLDVDGDRAVVSIDGGDDLTKLVGRKGEVLDALQELTRLAVQQATGERSRLMLDIARWRADRRDRLARLGREVAERVLSSGEREALDPMTPFERKIVHDAVAVVDGVVSESEGAEPKRRVVVLPS
ncbi:KH domain-containing protein [Gordonia sp. JH63]|uniref:Jag family protein n=1 Tax=Gordonia TaxID=2053 RepID=UPI00131F63D6|nr:MULTISPECIES: R3H domain-containing nucleic acid-binding protein [unclassified Gordonia (in: high G+C Gram-positive bacteria)]MBR7194544.1 KH domain-containing protein [Gordonia sp. SCSIO 19800]QHD87915.1 KH domain-containing protein [Gordonia sp. JH63]